jgi:hypothetical protein
MALDGTKWHVPATPANARAFGRPGASRGTSAGPQAQVVALSEWGTPAVCDAGVGPPDTSEDVATRRLRRSGGPGRRVTYDRGGHSFDLVVATRARRAHVRGRLPANVPPRASARGGTAPTWCAGAPRTGHGGALERRSAGAGAPAHVPPG